MGVSSKLLHNLDKVRIFAREVELLGEAISDSRAKAIAECRDLVDIRPVLPLCLIQNAFKLSNVCRDRVRALLERIQLIFRLLNLIRVVINTLQLLQNCLKCPNLLLFSSGKLREYHGLYRTLKVEIHVVELCHSIPNCLSIHMKLCLYRRKPCIKF